MADEVPAISRPEKIHAFSLQTPPIRRFERSFEDMWDRMDKQEASMER